MGKYETIVKVHDLCFKNILQILHPDLFLSSLIKTQTLPASQAHECHLELAVIEVKSRVRAGETEATYLCHGPVPHTLLNLLQVLSEAMHL